MIEKILVTVNHTTSVCKAELVTEDPDNYRGSAARLTKSMKAAMAAEWCDSGRGGNNSDKITYDLAAKMLEISVPIIKKARRIMNDNPELFLKIKEGGISVGRAYESMYR